MSMLERIISIFDSPSRRKDIDYTKAISSEAKTAVFLVLFQLHEQTNAGEWFRGVIEDFVHLRHDFLPYRQRSYEFDVHPLSVFVDYLADPSSESVAFLDFLELAFKNWRAPKHNDIILSINRVLEEHDCPYKLSEFVFAESNGIPHLIHEPLVYLAQEPIIETQAITPALGLFADPDFAASDDSFRKALKSHKEGDYPGCITSCAAAVEGTVKVIAKKRNWSLTGTGVGKLTESFVHKSGLPTNLNKIAKFLAERRQNIGDAHGQERVPETTEAEARLLIGLSAAFIVFVASELP